MRLNRPRNAASDRTPRNKLSKDGVLLEWSGTALSLSDNFCNAAKKTGEKDKFFSMTTACALPLSRSCDSLISDMAPSPPYPTPAFEAFPP
jgi:hypothetical protein